ncbi:hypothetical protein HDU99_007327 [Rhizoclosmatium hyalinum]|nr:hypothetical protein HDU99_007327 [Rhizoclosmatium hyalinum]
MKIVNPLLFFTLYSGLITAMKNQSYIELGVINSYSYVDGAQLDASGSIVTSFQSSLKLTNIDISGYGNDGGTYFTDLMMQIAVKMINENPYILPNTTVILRRFNDMDPTRHIGNNVSTVTTGFATITAMEIGKQKDLFGLVSAEYSSVLNYVGELTSVYKIPTCGLSQLSPRFSDKNLYPYFFRMISGMTGSRGLGNNYVKLFRSWNVNRVGIIVQQDVTYSYLAAIDMKRVFSMNGILLLAECSGRTGLSLQDIAWIATCLKTADTRYIVILGNPDFVSKVYYYAGSRHGLVNADHVWTSPVSPLPYTDPVTLFGPDYYNYLPGFIQFSSNPTFNVTDLNLFSEIVRQAAIIADYPLTVDIVSFFDTPTAFDCAMTLMIGLDRMLKENGGFPKNWRDLLNHTAFSNTGYNGLVQAPTILSAEGDLVLGFTACVYNGTMFTCNNFGKTNDAGFSYYMKPQFFGGSYIPPPDSPPIQEITYFWETIATQHGQIIVVLISLGLIVCLLCLKFLVENRRKSVVRAKILSHSVSIVLGIMIIYASLALYLNEATVVTCNLRIWMLAFGCSLCLAAFIFKNIFISQVISARKKLKREYIQHLELSRELCLTATVLVENIIVIIYALKGGSVPSYAPVGLNSINVCKSTSSSEHWETAIYAYNIALAVALLPTVYFQYSLALFEYLIPIQLDHPRFIAQFVTKKENYARLEFRNIVVEVVGLDGTNVGDEVMAKFQEMKQTFQRRIAAALEKSDTEAVLKKVFSHEILSNGGVNGAMSNDEQ